MARNPSTELTLDHDLDAVPEMGRHLTVAELAEHVDDLAGRLWTAGVRAGEHVAIHKSANFDVWMLATAAAQTGAVPVMLSPALDGATVGALLERLDRPHLLSDATKLDALGEVPVGDLTKQVITVAGSVPGTVSLAELDGSARVRPVLNGPDDPAMITHTSGTTGIPKLIVHTPRSMGTRLRPQWWLLSLIRKQETVAIDVPFVHSRTFAAMSLVLLKAMPTLLLNDPEPEQAAESFVRHRPGLVEALPNALMAWEKLADDPRKPFSSIRYFSSTFDAIHPRTIGRILDSSDRRMPLFVQIYGQSEVGPAVGRFYLRRFLDRANGRCVGWTMPGCAKVRVVSRDGNPPSKNNPGHIEVAWPGLAKTYHGEAQRYATNRYGDWWRTGDIGYRTRLGCLHMFDREIDMIDGVRSTLEVEDLILDRLEELGELVLVRGSESEPIPVLCTNDDQPLDRQRWHAAVGDLPQLAEPVQLPEAELPRTATLKVQRVELSRTLRERIGRARDVSADECGERTARNGASQ
ncbi:class I adenylate-forming enzyme family protein [Saccharomonospora saliphila]|uniref:class I adenylate-forming enzyme family protein n=1 Tax=Saccharomonospora saliphila TaxID=369829 RepID=UPI00035F3942|nr:AMP-binding protein [Saccharomonospora saliphila]